MRRYSIPSEFWRSLPTTEIDGFMHLLDRGAESEDRRFKRAYKRAAQAMKEYVSYGRMWIHVIDKQPDEREVLRLSITFRAGLEHRSAELRLAVAELAYAARGVDRALADIDGPA